MEKLFWFGVLLVLGAFDCTVGLDELLSARCQAKCLENFENAAKAKGFLRRQMKHSIIPLCKDDVNCSSCAVPCREPFQSLSNCVQVFCKDAVSLTDCSRSCHFLKEIYTFKPGSCPLVPMSSHAQECVRSCGRDGDCPNYEKCCSHGCGWGCVSPANLRRNHLPKPMEVSVEERKRGRSVVIRWVMSRMRPEHTNTYANLYVVQWKWGVKPNEEKMTNWQTISIRNKLYAILKHLLSPGRYYKFRVAAVNLNGSQGFSEGSIPFRLSKSPKGPRRPRNLTKGVMVLNENGLVSQEIHWLPPSSDLPMVHYQVIWSQTKDVVPGLTNQDDVNFLSNDTTNAVQNDMPSSAKRNAVDDDRNAFVSLRNAELVAASQNHIVLPNLHPHTNYLVEVHAISESETEEIHGEAAFIYVFTSLDSAVTNVPMDVIGDQPKTPKSTFSVPNTFSSFANPIITETVDNDEPEQDNRALRDLHVEKPYFQNGLLKATLRWKFIPGDLTPPFFEISWGPSVCIGATYPSLNKPLIATTEDTVYDLYDLQFGCHYSANVTLLVREKAQLQGSSAGIRFETPACQDTPIRGGVAPACPTLPPDVPSVPENLNCQVFVNDQTGKHRRRITEVGWSISARCSWSSPTNSDKPVTGYRVITGQKFRHNMGFSGVEPFPSIDRNTVEIRDLSENERKLYLEPLLPDMEYIVQVQAISEIGVGPSVYKTFFSPSLKSKSKQKDLDQPTASPVNYENQEDQLHSQNVNKDKKNFKRQKHSDALNTSSQTVQIRTFAVSFLFLLYRICFAGTIELL